MPDQSGRGQSQGAPERFTEPVPLDRVALLLRHPEADDSSVIYQARAVADRLMGDDLTALAGYQRGLKRAAAEAAGLPFDAYFHLPYAEWAEIRDGR